MSAQMALEFSFWIPPADTQCGTLLRAFQRGETLTVAEALSRYGVYALSQRVGELKGFGWPIVSERVQVGPKTWVARYRMAPQ